MAKAMRTRFSPGKTAASVFLAPVLLWLSSTAGTPFLRNTSDQDLFAPWGRNSSRNVLEEHMAPPNPGVTPLENLKPPSQPLVLQDPSPEISTFFLACQVPGGLADTIEWKRDGVPFSGNRIPGTETLSLPVKEKSTCGSYSCNASNLQGWKESLPLDVTFGISRVLQISFCLSASALVSAAFSGWGIMLPLCQPHKLRIRGKVLKWLSIYVNGLVGSSSALAFVALILWSYDQGLTAALIPPLFLLLYVMLITLLVVGTILCRLETVQRIKDSAAQRLVNFCTPMGVLLVAVTSGLLLREVVKLEEQGCAAPVDLAPVTVGVAGICFLPFMAIFVVHCADMKKRAAEDRNSRRENWKKVIQNRTIQFL